MNRHLSHEEIVDAAEGALQARRATHLDACARCRAAVTEVRTLLSGLADDAPGPDPQVLDDLSARVRAAVARESGSTRTRRSTAGWIALVGAAAAVVLVAGWWTMRLAPDATDTAPAPVVVERAVPEPSWDVMTDVASTMSADELWQATGPLSPGTAMMLGELSVSERAAFVELLRREMGERE